MLQKHYVIPSLVTSGLLGIGTLDPRFNRLQCTPRFSCRSLSILTPTVVLVHEQEVSGFAVRTEICRTL